MRIGDSRLPPWRLICDLTLALYPLALVLFVLVTLIAPQRQGVLALAQVFAHYLFAATLFLVPLALLRNMVTLRMALAATSMIFLLLYPPALNFAPPPASDRDVTVLAWNLYFYRVPAEEMLAVLDARQPDVVAFQEVNAQALGANGQLAARYPYQVIRPERDSLGTAILSRYPVLESGVFEGPQAPEFALRLAWARLDIDGRPVMVVNAHPVPPLIRVEGCHLIFCYNMGIRDQQISAIRAFIDDLQARTGDPLIVAGDMNVTEREQAYFDLSAGLRDAHRAAGVGFGFSWRPRAITLPFALIRIDYMFTNDQVRPLAFHTDCTFRGSDHCLNVGRFGL